MSITSEDLPQVPGSPNASMAEGQASGIQKDIKSVQSQGRGAPKGGPPPPGGAPPQGQPPEGQHAQPPPPNPQQNGRLDMNAVFPPMPEMQQQQPWRDVLRTAAYHPDAGPALKNLADMISKQHGPLR